ncbi:MAG TPA: GNAT family N-acetyltransferase [Pseudonocardia sp.]
MRGQAGFTQLYLFADIGGRLVGGGQILVRALPVVGRVGYLAYGPLVAPDAPDPTAVRTALVDGLERVGREMLSGLFVQPPEDAYSMSADLLARGFRRSAAGIAPVGSIRIDLTECLDTIRARFGRRLRSWTNRWADRGVVVRRGDERDLPLLYALSEHSAAAQGYRPMTPTYVETLYRELAPEHAALFVGELDGVPLAADLVTRCGGLVRGRISGFDRSGPAAQVSLPAAVRWEILKWAKDQDCRWLDFGGLTERTLDILLTGGERPDEGWPAVDQPKLTFGGTAFRYPPPVEIISSPSLRTFFDIAQRSPRGQQALDLAARLLRSGRSALPQGRGSR